MSPEQTKHTIITPARSGVFASWIELWSYRSLYVYLFKQTALRRFQDAILGPSWMILRPLIPSIVAIIIFTNVVPISTGDTPYPIFYFAGFMTWGIFASIVIFVPRAMRMNRGMMKKMYFPRLLIPLASLAIPIAEFLVIIGVFSFIVAFYASDGPLYLVIGPQLLLMPFLVVMTVILAISVGMVVGVFSLVARDMLFTLPHFIQLWMLCTPLLYPISLVPENWRWLIYTLNPMAQIVEAGRWSLLQTGNFDGFYFSIAVIMVFVFATLSTLFFLRAEEIFMNDI